MTKQAETTVTAHIAPLLAGMMPGWHVETEQKPFEDDNKKPDIIAWRDGRETIVIEAKSFDTANDEGVKRLRTHFGKSLNPDYTGDVSDNLRVGLAIRYPESVQVGSLSGLQKRLVHADDIEYRLVTEDSDGNFPMDDFAKGTLSDIADALYRGAVPVKQIEDAITTYRKGIKRAVRSIEVAVKKKPIIGERLSEILGREAAREAYSTACIFIVDAFIFQEQVAGKPGFEDVEALSHYDEPNVKMDYRSIINDWTQILEVNYVPIFRDAKRILVHALRKDVTMARKVLRILWQTANEIVGSHLPHLHELGGEIFQEVVEDRAYVKANYTLPESAALLSALVCPDIDVNNLPKVADYACGSGALLNGVYKRIQRLYEQKKGRTSAEIHRQMMEEHLCGSDIYSHATHLTFTAMAAAHPEETLGATRVITAPIGKQEDGRYLTGSLELLDDELLLPTMGIEAELLDGEEDEATVDINREFPHGEMDIVIINPPFSSNADNNSTKGKSAFKGSKRAKAEEKELRNALKRKEIHVGAGNNGLGSYFVDMADRKLKTGGTMGFILLSTALMGTAMQKMRRMLAEEYHDVIVVTIAGERGHDSAFSSDTSMAECMVVATKGEGANTGQARFACLTARPDSLLASQKLAREMRQMPVTRRIEDSPQGGDELRIGGELVGHIMECPIDEKEWAVCCVRAFSLMQMARRLRHGELHFPRMLDSIALPMCQIGDIADLSPNSSDIKNERHGRGAFQVRDGLTTPPETYPSLWHVTAETQRAMQTAVDSYARIVAGKEEKARKILLTNSRTHYHMMLTFNANSQLASFTEEPSIGACSLGNVCLRHRRYESAWTLWTNSTFGMFCHWMHSGKQRPGRGKLTWSSRATVLTLDVRQLSEEQLEAADQIFADLKGVRMLPYNECARDQGRHVLDARLLSEVLGITDAETHRAVQTLREMLCAEPTIKGTKLEKNYCNLEKEREKFNLGGSETDDRLALEREKSLLRARGIYLP